MATPIVMPRLGDFMMEGTVAGWAKSKGDAVSQGDVIAEIGDEELDAAQPPARQLAQELRPDRLGLRGADLHAQHLAPSVAVDADGDDDGDRHDAPPATDLQVGGVDPQIRPVAFDRPLQEGLHLAVDLLAQPADLALGDAGHPHRLHQVVDRAGRHPLDAGFLDHRRQRLLGHAAGFEERGEEGARPELRDAQFDGPGAGLPVPVAIAVALSLTQRVLLAIAGAGGRAHLQLAAPTSSSVSRSAAKPIISRSRSASGVFSTNVRRLIISSVIGALSGQRLVSKPDPTGER